MARRACTVFTLLLAGCAIEGKPDLLGFIEDGRTTREQVLLQLGPPSHVYEDQRILTFRIAEDAGGQTMGGMGDDWGESRACLDPEGSDLPPARPGK